MNGIYVCLFVGTDSHLINILLIPVIKNRHFDP